MQATTIGCRTSAGSQGLLVCCARSWSKVTDFFCCFTAYMPPEVAQQTRFSSRSDVWGVGVILYVMLTGGVPYCITKV